MTPDTTIPLFRPLCQQPPQPEAAQAQPNSKQHTMQTGDKNRMDTCHCGLAHLPGCTLKIKNKTQGSGNAHKMRFWVLTVGISVKREGWCCVCASIKCGRGHAFIYTRVGIWTEWDGAALSQHWIPGERRLRHCLMLHTVNLHRATECGGLFNHPLTVSGWWDNRVKTYPAIWPLSSSFFKIYSNKPAGNPKI